MFASMLNWSKFLIFISNSYKARWLKGFDGLTDCVEHLFPFVCVFMFPCTCRMDKTVPQQYNATGGTLVDINEEHQVIADDHAYSAVDIMQQQMIVASDNPAYSKGFISCTANSLSSTVIMATQPSSLVRSRKW